MLPLGRLVCRVSVVLCYRRYKDEYAEAIREIEAVKSEMEAVKQKASTTMPTV